MPNSMSVSIKGSRCLDPARTDTTFDNGEYYSMKLVLIIFSHSKCWERPPRRLISVKFLQRCPIVTLDGGCPMPGPSLTGCQSMCMGAPLSPLSKDTIPSNLGLINTKLWFDEWDGPADPQGRYGKKVMFESLPFADQ